MGIRCCHNCPDRHIGCHAVCERYIAEKVAWDAMQAKYKAERELDATIPKHAYGDHGIARGVKRPRRRK